MHISTVDWGRLGINSDFVVTGRVTVRHSGTEQDLDYHYSHISALPEVIHGSIQKYPIRSVKTLNIALLRTMPVDQRLGRVHESTKKLALSLDWKTRNQIGSHFVMGSWTF